MDVGVYLPQVGFTWDEYRAPVDACDREGIESLWLMDHTHLPAIPAGGAGPDARLPGVPRHADVWNCPTYALAVLEERRTQLHAECARIGRDPATLGTTEEAVLALVARREDVDTARALGLRRFAGPGWGFETHGYCGTPDEVLRRLEERRP